MYVCGPTVYDQPHIGHARSAYIFDVARRYLAYRGYQVKFVRNVTDVDDKIIDKAKAEFPGEDLIGAVKKVSEKYLASYHEALQELGITNAGISEPKASEYIPKMVKFIGLLIEKGMAYQSGGDVYFDITKAKEYGKLSNQSLEKMESGTRVLAQENKKNPLDFALWKSAKENEPSWVSPWGKGRPGWHIECSVMSSDILGDKFDIHGGGIDLIFPHHENEIAQSEGAGKAFACYWMHHGLLTINGQKMAKSLGNFVTIKDFLAKYPADVLKLFFLQTHYSQPVDFTWEAMEEKRSALERITIFLGMVKKREEGSESFTKTNLKKAVSAVELEDLIKDYREDFLKAMDDDFNTPNAVAVLYEIVNICNKVLYDSSFNKAHLPVLKYALETIKEYAGILGISFEEKPLLISEEQIKESISMREDFKKQKLYAQADKIRKELEEKGIILEDSKDGKTTWRKRI